MISLEPNSSAVYFPLHMMRELVPRRVQEMCNDNTKVLLSGLRMTVVFQRGAAYVQSESAVQYANKEYFQSFQPDQRHRNGPKVPLLQTDHRGAYIAGVKIRSAHEPIVDKRKRAEIEESISKKLLSVEYMIRGERGQFVH